MAKVGSAEYNSILATKTRNRKFTGDYVTASTVEELDACVKEAECPVLYKVAAAWIASGDKVKVGCGRVIGSVERKSRTR